MIANIREARKCLESYGLRKSDKPNRDAARRRQLTERQRWLLHEMNEGCSMQVFRVRETLSADLFDALVLDASHNSLIDGYGEVPDDWKELAKSKITPDFKPVNASRLGGFTNLDTVPENGTYLLKQQTDERVTYTPTKKGNLLSISMEAMFGDALGALNDQAGKLGNAAKNTLNEFVIGTLFDDNPTCDYDSVALFHASHSNLNTSAALSTSKLEAAIASVMNQTGVAGETIYLRPKMILCSPTLAVAATSLVSNAPRTGGTENVTESGHFKDFVLPKVWWSPHINSISTTWYLTTNVPVIEVSFVRSMTPEILREPENTGKSFETDAIRWKVRHSYSGDVIEHRGAVKNTA